MKKSGAKTELLKIARSNAIPPHGKLALFKGLRAEITRIEQEHGKCTYHIKCFPKESGLPVIQIIPRVAKRDLRS